MPLVFQPTFYQVLKLKTFDALVEERQPSNYFSILNITEKDVETEGGYPFPRKRLAEIQNDLIKKGALGVGWVISFPQPDRFDGDMAFAESLASAPSILATFENENGVYPLTTGTVILGEDHGGFQAKGVIENVPLLREAAYQGIAVAPTDVDQLVRRMPLLLRTPDGWVSAYGTEVLKVLAGADTYVIKTNENGIQEVRVKGIPAVPTDSLGRKWISWVDTPEFSLDDIKQTDLIKDRFVFVGVTALGVMPQIATPVGLLEPHKIQAALSESILIQDSPSIPDFAVSIELLMFIVGVSFVWLVIIMAGINIGLVLASMMLAFTIAMEFHFVRTQGMLIDFTWSFVAQFIAASVAFYIRFREQYKLRQQIKKQFEHYLDPRQVKALQSNPSLLKLGGERRTCTFLFTDVRGFTAMSERMDPELVTVIMNEALTIQSDTVKKYGGMVDKYIGDAMMAIFNAPIDMVNHEEAAVLCAQEIQKQFKESSIGVEIGIGVNTGEAIIGNMGSATRFDYTAIGDAVNLAARLESSTKEVGEDIVIGENTAQACSIPLAVLPSITVKGKQDRINIFTLIR